jgi:hypothetical protein
LARRPRATDAAHYIDLENPEYLSKLADTRACCTAPAPGQFPLPGSASIVLLRQSSESLAGRVAHAELRLCDMHEVEPEDQDRLWIAVASRSGYSPRTTARARIGEPDVRGGPRRVSTPVRDQIGASAPRWRAGRA